jgi:ribonuclease P protein component
VLYVVSTSAEQASQFGFIVSKAVGNAVTRNLVKRRLREIVVQTLRDRPHGINVVVRALPPAANASWDELQEDYRRAFSKVAARLAASSETQTQGFSSAQEEEPQGIRR